jgi:hypothetical protein
MRARGKCRISICQRHSVFVGEVDVVDRRKPFSPQENRSFASTVPHCEIVEAKTDRILSRMDRQV